MKRKRLARDIGSWGFGGYPYYQLRVDIAEFCGLVCLIHLAGEGTYYYWDFPIAGKSAVCGKNMTWLQLIPDGKSHVLTAKYVPVAKTLQGTLYADSVSVWYADVIDRIEYDADGVAVFVDKYVDVIFTPQGDVKVDDIDELDEALALGDITKQQYESALTESDLIINQYCTDIVKTEVICNKILSHVWEKISSGIS